MDKGYQLRTRLRVCMYRLKHRKKDKNTIDIYCDECFAHSTLCVVHQDNGRRQQEGAVHATHVQTPAGRPHEARKHTDLHECAPAGTCMVSCLHIVCFRCFLVVVCTHKRTQVEREKTQITVAAQITHFCFLFCCFFPCCVLPHHHDPCNLIPSHRPLQSSPSHTTLNLFCQPPLLPT